MAARLRSSPLLGLLTLLVAARSIQEAGEAMLDFAGQQLACDLGVVGMRERSSPFYAETVWRGVDDDEIAAIRTLTRANDEGINPVEERLNDASEPFIRVTEESSQLIDRPLVDSLVVRLAPHGVSIGTVLLARSQGALFHDDEIELILFACEHLGQTMARLRLIEDQQLEHARLSAMLAAVNAQTEEHDLAAFLDRLAEIAGKTVNADTVALYAFDESHTKTIATGHFGRYRRREDDAFLRREALPPMLIPAERAMIEQAAPVTRSRADLPPGDYSLDDPLWRGDVLIPLRSRRGVEGIAYISRSDAPPDFSEEELALLLSLGQQAGSSIERQRATAESRLRGHHLEALNRLGRSLSHNLDLEAVCQEIYDEILTFSRLDRFAVALLETDPRRIRVPFAMSDGERISGQEPEALPWALMRQSLRDEQATVAQVTFDPEAANAAGHAPWHSVIAPMKRDHLAFGLLVLQRQSQDPFSQGELQTFETIARQSAAAVENARLYSHVSTALDQAGRREESLRAIVKLASVVSSEPDQDVMIASFARELNQLMPGRFVAILRHEADRNSFRWLYRFASGEVIDPALDEMPDDRGITSTVFWSRIAERVNYANFDARWWGRPADSDGITIEHMMAAPLIVEGDTLGVFVVIRRDADPYTDEEFAVFQVVAELVAGIMRGILLLERLSIERDLAQDAATDLAQALQVVRAERGKAEKQSTAIGRVLDATALLASHHDPEQLARTASRLVTEIVSCDRVAVMLPWWSYTDTMAVIRYPDVERRASVHGAGESWESDRLRETVLSRQPLRLQVSAADRDETHLICVPLDAGKAFAGALAVTRSGGDPFTDDEFATVQIFAAQLSAALANANLMARNRELLVAGIRALVSAVDAKDPHTGGHSERVAAVARLISTQMSLSHSDIETIELAALLHDIGKIGVPDAILHKPGRLTEAERVIMMRHAANGAEMLAQAGSDTLAPLAPLVRHHHEWVDGRGYPDGLRGEEIPIGAAIIAVADAFDTMTSDRPYRQRGTMEEALAELRNGAGTQFHEQAVDAIESLAATGALQQLFGDEADPRLNGGWEPMASLASRSAPLGDAMALRLLVDMVPMTRLIVDTETFFQQVTDLIQRTLSYPRVALYLVDESTEKLARMAQSGDEPSGSVVQPLAAGIRGDALSRGEPRRVAVAPADPAFDPEVDPAIGSMLLAPLDVGDHLIGLLAVESDDEYAFSQGDLGVLVAVAGQVASAINVARLHAVTKRASLTDELTGVGNHRAFWSSLESHLAGAVPFALLMMDVEGLKRVNDTRGHLAGDDLLRVVARVIREQARPGDLVARLGGDEFAVILDGLDFGATRRLGALIREQVRQECERMHWASTVRFGVAVRGPDGETASQIVSVADQRLYAMRASTMQVSQRGNRRT